MPPLLGLVWLIFIVVAIWSLVHFMLYEKRLPNVIPATICAVTLGIVMPVPFIKLHFNFVLNKSARERVVYDVSVTRAASRCLSIKKCLGFSRGCGRPSSESSSYRQTPT
jgi:hypothetical protein